MPGTSDGPDYLSLLADVRLLRERGLGSVRRLNLSALHQAAVAAGLSDTADSPQPAVIEDLLRRAVDTFDGGELQEAASQTFGLAGGLKFVEAAERRRQAARSVNVAPETFRKKHEKLIVEQVAEAILALCRANRMREASVQMERRHPADSRLAVACFGPEWQGVEATGTYRLQYADNGHGMSKDELREYMVTLGKGGKVVGGPHDNYALGSRMTLLPWNPEGIVVISVVGGTGYMVKMMFDPDAAEGEGEYVLEEVSWEEDGEKGLATVYPPYIDAELGFDWADTIPDFITKAGHGTTFTLLGRSPSDDTIDGDPERGERHRFLGRKYFNSRFWDLPEGVALRVYELPENRADWPTSGSDKKGQFRTVRGAKSLIEYRKSTGEDFIASKGTVDLSQGTKVHWWLRTEPKVETGGLGATSAYISVLYRRELYGQAYTEREDGDDHSGANVYRQFGIGSDKVRRRVFVIIEPPEYDEATGAAGVAPSTGRADLYWMGAGTSPRSVKPADWSAEFGEKLPEEILDAIKAEYESREHDDDREERLKRVMDRFAKRWRAPRARVQDEETDTTTTATTPGTAPRAPIDVPSRPRRPRKRRVVVVRGRAGESTIGQPGTGDVPAKKTTVSAGVPNYRWVTENDINSPGMIAVWQKPSAQDPQGCVELDKEHAVIRSQIEYWQNQYPRSVAMDIEKLVMDAYGEVAVAKVSHMHALTGTVFSEEQRDEMLLNPALTTSMLGLISEDALIAPRTGKLGTKRRKVEEASQDETVEDEATTEPSSAA